VTWGAFTSSALRAAGAEAIIEHPSALAPYVVGLNARIFTSS
jgi:hypothetical protein